MDLLQPVASGPARPAAVAGQAGSARVGGACETGVGADTERRRGRQWQIGCHDLARRERQLTVLVERDTVVLVGPPGETAVLSAGQLDQLRAVLQEAADEAER